MRNRGLLGFLGLVAAGALVWVLATQHRPTTGSVGPVSDSEVAADNLAAPKAARGQRVGTDTVTSQTAELVAGGATSVSPSLRTPTPAETPVVPDTSESSSLPAATVLENMRTSIRQFAAAIGENPVGTNPEITEALGGENTKHLNFLKADGNRINSKGELVDVFGTPYFFHQISGQEMEIRSAGPDRVMYTGDDLVIK